MFKKQLARLHSARCISLCALVFLLSVCYEWEASLRVQSVCLYVCLSVSYGFQTQERKLIKACVLNNGRTVSSVTAPANNTTLLCVKSRHDLKIAVVSVDLLMA